TSFLEASFSTSFKDAVVHPVLKKHDLPHENLSIYRPISNINFLSKILERIILFLHECTFSDYSFFVLASICLPERGALIAISHLFLKPPSLPASRTL